MPSGKGARERRRLNRVVLQQSWAEGNSGSSVDTSRDIAISPSLEETCPDASLGERSAAVHSHPSALNHHHTAPTGWHCLGFNNLQGTNAFQKWGEDGHLQYHSVLSEDQESGSRLTEPLAASTETTHMENDVVEVDAETSVHTSPVTYVSVTPEPSLDGDECPDDDGDARVPPHRDGARNSTAAADETSQSHIEDQPAEMSLSTRNSPEEPAREAQAGEGEAVHRPIIEDSEKWEEERGKQLQREGCVKTACTPPIASGVSGVEETCIYEAQQAAKPSTPTTSFSRRKGPEVRAREAREAEEAAERGPELTDSLIDGSDRIRKELDKIVDSSSTSSLVSSETQLSPQSTLDRAVELSGCSVAEDAASKHVADTSKDGAGKQADDENAQANKAINEAFEGRIAIPTAAAEKEEKEDDEHTAVVCAANIETRSSIEDKTLVAEKAVAYVICTNVPATTDTPEAEHLEVAFSGRNLSNICLAICMSIYLLPRM